MRLKRLILPIICSIRGRALERTFAKNVGLVDGVRAIGDYRTNAAFTRRLSICLRIIALVRDNGAGINIGAEVEEHFEVAAVARFAAGQMEADRIAVEIGLEMDLG